MLEIGKPFPDFTLPDQNEKKHSLAQYADKWLVVYFYPKDNTSGCSMEAANFVALHKSFAAKKAAILGVSADSVKSHKNFATKLVLPFPLLSDPEHLLLEACGVWQQKKMAGREYMGIVRTTVLVDPKGIVRDLWLKVKVPGHADEVLQRLRELQS